MKYVYTSKVALTKDCYNFTTLSAALNEMGATRDFHNEFPTPTDLTVPNNSIVSEELLQLLSIWYNRGTALHFEQASLTDRKGRTVTTSSPTTLRIKHPRPIYRYEFVNSLPNAYIQRNATSPNAAYAYGQHLIHLVNKTNLVPFHLLEDAYRSIARQCLTRGRFIKVYSPNEKTILEARAELETAHDIECIFDTTDCPKSPTLPLEALQLYAKVFSIELPVWFIKANSFRTNRHGFATVFSTDQSNFVHSTEPDPNKASYAGIDFDPRATPVTLRRDATPTRLSNQAAELRQLAAQVEFFLRLPEDQQDEFISMDFARCPNCHHIHTVRDGCPCGATAPLTDEEWELYHYTAPSRLRVD